MTFLGVGGRSPEDGFRSQGPRHGHCVLGTRYKGLLSVSLSDVDTLKWSIRLEPRVKNSQPSKPLTMLELASDLNSHQGFRHAAGRAGAVMTGGCHPGGSRGASEGVRRAGSDALLSRRASHPSMPKFQTS